MKRSYLILLAAMLLVLALTGCGRRDRDTQSAQTPPTSNEETAVPPQNDPLTGTDRPAEETPAHREDSTDGDAAPDVGVSYEQMLRNGRVRDTDGLLRDGENAGGGTESGIRDAAKDVARSARNAADDLIR